MRLLANNRQALRDFRGDNEYAVMAYLARIVHAVVADNIRRKTSQKRSVPLVPLDAAVKDGDSVSLKELLPATAETLPDRILSERLVPERLRELIQASSSGLHVARDTLIFQLYALDGLSAREIAALPIFNMTVTAIEAVIRRTRDRLRAALTDESDLST